MELNPSVPLQWSDADLLLRVGAAAIIGLILGIDRELRSIPAGLRTHGLVCLSSAAMTASVIALYNQIGGPETRLDPLRLYQGAGAFFGIVAAGLIVVHKGDVHNITTAVHLWLACVIGIACGAGQWPLVAIGTVLALAMMILLRIVESRWIEPRADEPKDQS